MRDVTGGMTHRVGQHCRRFSSLVKVRSDRYVHKGAAKTKVQKDKVYSGVPKPKLHYGLHAHAVHMYMRMLLGGIE